MSPVAALQVFLLMQYASRAHIIKNMNETHHLHVTNILYHVFIGKFEKIVSFCMSQDQAVAVATVPSSRPKACLFLTKDLQGKLELGSEILQAKSSALLVRESQKNRLSTRVSQSKGFTLAPNRRGQYHTSPTVAAV